MKKTKTAIWIVILFILQASAAHYMAILGATPILIFSYIASLAILEDDLKYTSAVGIICGICAGTLMGYNFFWCAAFVVLATLTVFFQRKKLLYTADILKVLIWTAIISIVWEIFGAVEQCIKFKTAIDLLELNVIIKIAYNAVISLIIYPLLKMSVYSSDKRKSYKLY